MLSAITASIISLIVVVIAAITDIRTGHIPNKLTFPYMAGAVLYCLVLCIIDGNWTRLAVAFVAAVILVIPGLLNAVGMGDIKLLIGVVFAKGPLLAFGMLCIGSLALLVYVKLRKPPETSQQKQTAVAEYKLASFLLLGLIIVHMTLIISKGASGFLWI